MADFSQMYKHLPHGESFHCIENIEVIAEHEASCTATFRVGSVYDCIDGSQSSLALLEAVAHAGALASIRQDFSNSRSGGVIISVHNCDLRISEIRLDLPYRLKVKFVEAIAGVLEVSGTISDEANVVGSVSMLIHRITREL
jgi:hypothetical protein